MAYEVFISYSKPDKTTADAVCGTLESRGVRCWIAPRDVEPGCDWSASIISALNVVRVMVLVFSSHANASPHVRREVQRAFGKNVTVIPFRVEAVRPAESLEYYLGPVHWLDALTTPLDRHLQQLADTVQRVIAAGPTRAAQSQPNPTPAPGPVPGAGPRVDSPSPPRPAHDPAPDLAPPVPAPARRSTGLILGLSAIAAVTVVAIAFVFFPRGERSRADAIDTNRIDQPQVTQRVTPARGDAGQVAVIPLERRDADWDNTQPVDDGSTGVTRDMPPELARRLAEMLNNRADGFPPVGENSGARSHENEDRIVWQDARGAVVVTNADSEVVGGGTISMDGAPGGLPVVGRDWTLPTLGLEMVYLYPDTFTLGSPAQEAGRAADEGPATRVTLSQGFWLGKFEVTRQQWIAVMGPIDEREPVAIDPETPVSLVTANDAIEFCRKLNAQERAAKRLPAGFAYALPSETQWEYACRAGTTTPFHFGRGLGASFANIDGAEPYGGAEAGETSDGPIPVGNYPPNDWGFFDMHGNVWEWTASAYTKRYPGGSVDDYENIATGREHVLRGGSWRDPAAGCRSAVRLGASPNVSVDSYGFRLALTRKR